MASLPTIEVKHPGGGTCWINEQDYDPDKHKRVAVAKKEAPKAEAPKVEAATKGPPAKSPSK